MSLPARRHRQAFDRAHAGALAPSDLALVDRERELGPTAKQRLEGARALDARELMTETEMDAGAEGEMAVRPAREVELLRPVVGLRIEIRRGEHRHDAIALAQQHAAELD